MFSDIVDTHQGRELFSILQGRNSRTADLWLYHREGSTYWYKPSIRDSTQRRSPPWIIGGGQMECMEGGWPPTPKYLCPDPSLILFTLPSLHQLFNVKFQTNIVYLLGLLTLYKTSGTWAGFGDGGWEVDVKLSMGGLCLQVFFYQAIIFEYDTKLPPIYLLLALINKCLQRSYPKIKSVISL